MVAAKKLSSAATAAKKTKLSSVSGKDKVGYGQDLVGSKVRVWWPIDRKYYKGVVDSFDSLSKKHLVLYDDGDEETLNLKKEQWELIEDDDDDDDDDNEDEDKSDNENFDATPEPPNRKSARTNGVMGDIGGKIVAAASHMKTSEKISEATNGKKKRASSSSSEAASEKVTNSMPSSKKSKKNMTDDEDEGGDEYTSDDESKPLQILVDKLKGKKKKKKRQEKEAPKEAEEGEKA